MMKKPFQILLTIFLTVILLSACNTAENPKTAQVDEGSTTTGNSNNEQQTSEEPKDSNTTVEQPVANQSDDGSITYMSNGKSITENTSKVESQKYTIQVLPGFTLTAEEPGKDLLYFEENENVSMRIETMSKNDTTFDDLKVNSEETMTAINEQYESFDLSPYLAGHSNIQNSAAYVGNFEDEQVIIVVLEKEELFERLTIFDQNKLNLTEALIKMGLTIEAK